MKKRPWTGPSDVLEAVQGAYDALMDGAIDVNKAREAARLLNTGVGVLRVQLEYCKLPDDDEPDEEGATE